MDCYQDITCLSLFLITLGSKSNLTTHVDNSKNNKKDGLIVETASMHTVHAEVSEREKTVRSNEYLYANKDAEQEWQDDITHLSGNDNYSKN